MKCAEQNMGNTTTAHSAMAVPELLPARMLNEFVYCPRLFFYEWVEGLYVDNADTVEGQSGHARVDKKPSGLPTAEVVAAVPEEKIHARSVMLSSVRHGLVAKIDLIEGNAGTVIPVDYKHGSPRQGEDGLELWDTDRIQLAVQAIVLRENGYKCNEGIVYFTSTRQRVVVQITEALIAEALTAAEQARRVAASGVIPPPLVNSPKCPRCSLVGICLPDETYFASHVQTGSDVAADEPTQLSLFPGLDKNETDTVTEPVRRLVPARDDLRPLYLNTPGLRVGISSGVLQIKDKDKLVQEVRLADINQVNLFGNIQLSTQAVQALCTEEIPIAYFSMGGWFYGITHGHALKNIFLRREQFRHADFPFFCLQFARALITGKIQNQRTMLQRNHVQPPRDVLVALKNLAGQALRADSLDTLLGIEGMASRIYFENFAGMIKLSEDPPIVAALEDDEATPGQESPTQKTKNAQFTFDFINRNRRPPRDAVNALLSLAYAVLAKDITITCLTVGFDPYLGFYHQPRFGRPALALDLMEPFRPLIADSAVLIAINNRMVTPNDFVQVGPGVVLKPEARKAFFRAYEQRMDTLVTHPLFNYRVNYRRILEIQTRLLARYLTHEILRYSTFVTR